MEEQEQTPLTPVTKTGAGNEELVVAADTTPGDLSPEAAGLSSGEVGGQEAAPEPAKPKRKAPPRRRKKDEPPVEAPPVAELAQGEETPASVSDAPASDLPRETESVISPEPAVLTGEDVGGETAPALAADEESAQPDANAGEPIATSEVVVPEAVEEAPDAVDTDEPVLLDELELLQVGRQEVAATGEPISGGPVPRESSGGDRRRGRGRNRGRGSFGPALDADAVLVPEAVLEEAPTGELDVAAVELSGSELPAGDVTQDEVYSDPFAADAEGGRRGKRDRRRGRDRNRDRGEQRPEQAGGETDAASEPPTARPERPTPKSLPALTGPGYVLVPEAILEEAPDEWIDEVPEEDEEPETGAPDQSLPGGRRRRRRGRDRDRREETPQPPKPAAAAPAAPVAAAPERRGPIITLHDDDSVRERRERNEPRDPREYKELLVNVADRETRIAVLENGRLVELHVEREERVVGGVYKGRVCNVLPGMDAAFVDIGLERNAFLYVGDILFDDAGGREGRDAGRDGREGGRGRGDGDSPQRRTSRDARISDLAKPGQEILVQVVKGPRGTKGARVSTKISIPGRYLVLMPEGDHLGVSRKVEDGKERERLRRIGEQLKPKGFGLIVRTEAEGRSEQELKQDLDYLVKSWNQIAEKNKRTHAPVVLHRDLGIILKTIRDLFGQDTDKLVIDSVEEYEKIIETLNELAPDLVDRVVLHDEREPLFSRFNLEDEIDKLLRRKVWLRNGAYLLIDTTEALTTIDVNTGKFVGTSSLAETILKTNLDAVDEIARQLRLRDIGGMIVLDFIDMSSSRDRQQVMRKLEDAFKRDRTRIKIAHISPLGLVEMTRKRTSEAVTDVMTDVCPYCQGRGRTWSPETMAINIERDILRLCAKQEVDAVMVSCNPETALWLIGPEGEGVERLERIIRRPVYVRGRLECHVEKFEVEAADMMEIERQMMPFRGGQVVEAVVTKSEQITAPRSAAWVDGYLVDLANGSRYQGQRIRVRLTDVRRSYALGDPVTPAGPSGGFDRGEPI